MDVKSIRDLRVATQEYLDKLDAALISAIKAAISKAAMEKGDKHYFDGLYSWLRSPFGFNPSAVEAYETILRKSQSTEETEYVYEHVLSGLGRKYEYPVSDWKLIAKYLNA